MPFYLTENGKKNWEIFQGIDAVAWILICCLTAIFLIGFFFIYLVHRRKTYDLLNHGSNGESSTSNKSLDKMTLFEEWQAPNVWLAIRAQDKDYLSKAFQMTDSLCLPWDEARQTCSHTELLFSPPIKGWIIVSGHPLTCWTTDIDHCFHLMKRLSRVLGLVQLFRIEPASGDHLWTQAMNGSILRGYANSNGVIWNQGELTSAEKKLHLECTTYGNALPSHSLESPAGNADLIYRLASLWSVDPSENHLLSAHNQDGMIGCCRVNRWTS